MVHKLVSGVALSGLLLVFSVSCSKCLVADKRPGVQQIKNKLVPIHVCVCVRAQIYCTYKVLTILKLLKIRIICSCTPFQQMAAVASTILLQFWHWQQNKKRGNVYHGSSCLLNLNSYDSEEWLRVVWTSFRSSNICLWCPKSARSSTTILG